VTVAEAGQLAERLRAERKRIVLANGCFDLLHVGSETCCSSASTAMRRWPD
jgi:bifunctional ADP-heptose synthase (sugar kinase/adenylyltransferase)